MDRSLEPAGSIQHQIRRIFSHPLNPSAVNPIPRMLHASASEHSLTTCRDRKPIFQLCPFRVQPGSCFGHVSENKGERNLDRRAYEDLHNNNHWKMLPHEMCPLRGRTVKHYGPRSAIPVM